LSVHADEQFGVRRGRAEVDRLVERLVLAAGVQGFTRQQMEAELGGDLHAYIRASINRQNTNEAKRLRDEKR
jgi:hypothetical protein